MHTASCRAVVPLSGGPRPSTRDQNESFDYNMPMCKRTAPKLHQLRSAPFVQNVRGQGSRPLLRSVSAEIRTALLLLYYLYSRHSKVRDTTTRFKVLGLYTACCRHASSSLSLYPTEDAL